MSWTYNVGLISDKDKVRLTIGDTDSNDQLLADEEINYFLTQQQTVSGAAIAAARSIGAKYARLCDISIESVSKSYSQKSKNFFALALQLESQAKSGAGMVGMSATGTSISEMETVDANTDRPQSENYQGMFDNPPQRSRSGKIWP